MVNTKQIKKDRIYIIAAIGLVLLFSYNLNQDHSTLNNLNLSDSKEVEWQSGEWQSDYEQSAKATLFTYDIETSDTPYYDYNNPVIIKATQEIIAKSANAKDAIKNSLEYVYKNINYITGETDSACYDGTAPTILSSGKGQCDTQSIVLISLLRKMGIAARPVGGCVFYNEKCRMQSFLQSLFVIRTPRFTELEGLELEEDAPSFSRGDIEALSRKGGLHAWVTAWLPEEGWVTLEATNGLFADTNCYYYHVEMFPANNEKDDICVTTNWKYAYACQGNNLNGLDSEGLGLVNQISP